MSPKFDEAFPLLILTCMFTTDSICQTGIYYLRTRPAVNAIQFTVSKSMADESGDDIQRMSNDIDIECLSCSA